MINGVCECGKVTFRVEGKILDFSHCHCSQCRRLHGAAFATFAGVMKEGFSYTSGESLVSHYASSEGSDRQFCGNCGSTLLVYTTHEPEWIYLSMSVVEGNPDTPPARHDWVGSKASWWKITDDLPQNEKYVPED